MVSAAGRSEDEDGKVTLGFSYDVFGDLHKGLPWG